MKKRLLILPIIVLTIIMFLGFGSKMIIQKTNFLSFLSGNTLEEKELSTVANEMYVTMLDDKAKVIATTNPGTQVDEKYSFTDTTKPQKQPNTNDNYFILFEIADTNGSSGYTKVEEDVIYTLELPKYIIPTDYYDEGIEPNEQCTNFSKNGETIACGGIYKNGDKYSFKVVFKNTINKRNVKAAYQFSITLNKSIEDIVFTLKTIDFGLPGAIQLFMEKEEPPLPPEEKDYDISLTGEWTSRTMNYAKWTATITDNHTDGYKMNGSLYIDFGPNMAFTTDYGHFFQYIKIYADGEELQRTKNGDYTALFKRYSQPDYTGYAVASMLNKEVPKLNSETSYPYSFSASQLKIDLSEIIGNEIKNTNIEGVHEWKIEFIAKEYSDQPTIYNAQIRFIDNNDLEKEYKNNTTINNYSTLSFNVSSTNNNINSYGVAESITFRINISNNNNNLLKIKSVPENSNRTGLYYIMDNIGFTAMNNYLSNSIQVRINGKTINFTKNGYHSDTVASGQISKSDPLLQKLFEKTDSYNDMCSPRNSSSYSNECAYFKSAETNEDGDYYWIVLSKDTAIRSENLYNQVYDYVNPSSDRMPKPAQWEFTLLNAKGSNVEITWNQNLQFYDRVSEVINSNNSEINAIQNSDSVLLSTIYVNEGYYTIGNATHSLLTPLRIKGEVLNDNFIKWEMKIDTQYMHTLLEEDSSNRELSTLDRLLLYFKIPYQQQIIRGKYYDLNTNSIVEQQTANSINTTFLSNCIQGNNYYSTEYDLFECTKYEELGTIYNGMTDYYTGSGYPNPYTLNHINKIYEPNYYTYYSASVVPKSINALQGNQKGEIRLVFFTKDDHIGLSEETIYVDAVALNKRKPYGRNSYLYSNPIPYFSITNKASISKYDVTKDMDETSSKNGNVIKQWKLNLDFTKYIYSYPMSHLYEEQRIPLYRHPDVYNGRYQFTDKFNSNSNEERIIAENTKIKTISIANTNNYTKTYINNRISMEPSVNTSIVLDDLNSMPQDENGYYTICHQSVKQFCLKIRYNYGSDCPFFDKNNENCTKYENMKYGFEVITEGFNKSFNPVFTYTTETNMENVARSLSSDSFSNNTIEIENIVKEYDWDKSDISGKPIISKKTTYELLADISVKKNVKMTEDTNYKNDTKNHEIITTIGNSPTEYIELTDFIDGIGKIGFNDTSSPEDVSSNYDDLKEIRKYLHIRDLEIKIKDHLDEDSQYTTIFSNNTFIPEYEGSTLQYINNTNELYKLHLVRSDGEKIESLKDIKISYTMNFYLDENNNYRLNELYEGKKFYISTNVEAIRTYESNPSLVGTKATKKGKVKLLSSTDGNYENKIDSTNHTLTVYASNRGVEVGADYLYPGEIEKILINNNDSKVDKWQINYITNSSGKSEKVSMDITDNFTFKINGDSAYNDRIIAILNKYYVYKNVKIYYNGKNTTIEDNPVYVWENPIENRNINFGDKTGNLVKNNESFELHLSPFDYGDTVIITYDFEVDYEKAYKEMIEEGYINDEMKLTDTNELLKISYTNRVTDARYPESFVEKSKSSISINDYLPNIHKKNNGRSNDETSWEINFNTGINSNNIKVKDNLEITTEDESMKSIIEEATVLKDLEIKIDGETVYSNDTFVEPWSNNIVITNKNLGYEFLFKDTVENSFTGENKNVVITYKSALDYNKYNGNNNSGVYSLKNTAILEKNDLTSTDVLESNGIPFDFPVEANKEFLGNNSDLTETNWKYTISTGKMDRKNLHISDNATLGTDFGQYLSISKLKITLNEQVIYDSENNINNLDGINLLDIEGNNLQLNTNGIYQFDIIADKLDKMSTLDVEYTLKVDKEAYILNKEILDNELLIQNQLRVTSDDGTEIEKEDNGSSKVTSKLAKKFDFLGYDSAGNPKMKWYIDVNLLSDYNVEELNGKQVIITDSLSDVLGLVDGTVQLKQMTITNNSSTIGGVIDPSKYELNTDNNTLTITILDPTDTNTFEISFETICYASLSEINNNASLQVGDEISEVKTNNIVQVFSPYSFGRVTSNDVLIHHIKAKKYFDGNLSSKQFVFEIQEVNEAGEPIENGFHARNTNAEDGTITFNGISYFEDGTYYYKIKEIPENDDSIIYDTTEYMLKIEVGKDLGDHVIEEISLINSDSDEIIFNNKTKKEQSIIDIIVNPNTKRVLYILLLIPLIIVIERFIRKKYTN